MPTDIQFTGQRLDEGTGLYYYGARYYDPVTGRFISPDTIVSDPMNSQTWNRYSYCLNNPLKYIDPSGHIVNISDPDLQAAWEMFSYYNPDIAQLLIDSPVVFNYSFGDGEGGVAYTLPENYSTNEKGEIDNIYEVNVVFDKSIIDPEVEGIEGLSWVMANENGHCLNIALHPTVYTPTRYEEAVIMQFQFRYGLEVGYSPVSDDMKDVYRMVMKAASTNLYGYTNLVDGLKGKNVYQKLNTALNSIFENTTYTSDPHPNWVMYDPYPYWTRMYELDKTLNGSKHY